MRDIAAPRQRQPPERHRRRDADAGAGQGDGARSSTSRRNARYPILGASLQRRGGIARHDAVAWGYRARRRRARRRHHPELRGHRHPLANGRRSRRRNAPGASSARGKVGVVAAGHSSVLADDGGLPPADPEPSAAGAGVRADQAGPRTRWSCRSAVHVYISQSDKGELVIGAGIDTYTRYAQRGSFQVIEDTLAALVELFPIFSRAADDCGSGAASSTSAPTPARSSAARRSRASTSTAAGAPAASRRRPARAGSSRTPSRRTGRTAERSRSRSTASHRALIDEHGAAGVAH